MRYISCEDYYIFYEDLFNRNVNLLVILYLCIFQQKNIVQRLVSDKAELLEKNNDTQGHYDIQIEQLKNKVSLAIGIIIPYNI